MIIYKTTNLVDLKIYIGQDHFNNSDYLGSGVYLKRAIIKYGRDNFKKEIIESCDSQEELDSREIYWIKFYNARDKKIGYNITEGGKGTSGYRHTQEFKNWIRNNNLGEKNAMYGKSLQEKWREMGYSEEEILIKNEKRIKKQSNSLLGEKNPNFGNGEKIEGDKNPFYKKKHSSINIEKFRDANSKKVIQLDKKGNLIKEWKSILEVKEILGIQCGQCCRGNNKTAGGFIWKYKNEAKN